jgi:3-phenylpropionate/trans-cinnamate dioxygenase ferredoxin reductase subunit
MRKSCRVTLDGQVFLANRGDVLLDAALRNGVDMPQNCRSGNCGGCRVRVVNGLAIGGECDEPGVVRACQSRVISDLQLEVEALPEMRTVAGQVSAIKRYAPDVVEIDIEPSRPIMYLPGQYLRMQFRGYPTRCYSPTASMDDFAEREFLHLHVRRIRDGQVSSAVCKGIREGHRVKILGPFGSAFLRPAYRNRLVLVARGTGFAPIWSIAVAAIREHRQRNIVMVVGARTIDSLYMINALCALARYPNVTIIPVVDIPQNLTSIVRTGDVVDHVPQLSAKDTVHACGPSPLVEAVRRMAAAAGAPCYGIPFLPQDDRGHLLSHAPDLVSGAKRESAAAGRVVGRRPSPLRFPKVSPFPEHAV